VVNKKTIAGISPKEKASSIGRSTTIKKDLKTSQKPNMEELDKQKDILKAPHHHKMKKIEPTSKKPSTKNKKSTAIKSILKLSFRIKFHTTFGQNLFITGNHDLLGNSDIAKAVPLHYFNDEFWSLTIELDKETLPNQDITYNYVLQNPDGTISYDWGKDKFFNPSTFESSEILIVDSWNYAGFYENAFYTEPFKNVLLNSNFKEVKAVKSKTVTHAFKIKAPLLSTNEVLFIAGSAKSLNEWSAKDLYIMGRLAGEDFYTAKVDFLTETFPISYKYGIYNTKEKRIICYEEGNNRLLYDAPSKEKQIIINDGFIKLKADTWKGAGTAIPVFSLRSNSSFGVGEFTDIKLLVDWSKQVGLKLIQILPINDTTATHTWTDSYPYAAISAFALHPLYLNLSKVVNSKNKQLLDKAEAQRLALNALAEVDYEAVMNFKLQFIQQIYASQKTATFKSKEYKDFFEKNKHWLEPYAVFCYLRDLYGTPDFNQWPAHNIYNANDIASLVAEESTSYHDIAINFFIQYHLHLQLREASEYAHAHGIILKGDIAIGVYRFGADTWQQPELYQLNMQAGAPPDDFALKGQNWGFPTYNWKQMKADGFTWWKNRFEQMSYYFDAFRIDHILGFFRIWSIPLDAVEGIMGYFVPSIPIQVNEFSNRGIEFNHDRYTKPFINDAVLFETFVYEVNYVKEHFLDAHGFDSYTLKPAFNTQRKVEKYFSTQTEDDFSKRIKQGLFDLISNVILFEVAGSQQQQYHFRFSVSHTSSFKYLAEDQKNKLDDLYINYFFRRQDNFWLKEALQKLPSLKRVTNMLVCGEDLGLVPTCVPDLMKQLGLLSLEIQRMPKDPNREFFDPADAPYLSVVTPSTHDMSTIRGWWEEDRSRIERFYHQFLHKHGDTPLFCEPEINKDIILQHLNSPAMWCVFQLQDLMGIDAKIRRLNPNDERINIPANPKHYWRYRMHLTLEDLLGLTEFNQQVQTLVSGSGR